MMLNEITSGLPPGAFEAIVGVSNTLPWPGDSVGHFAEDYESTKVFPVSGMTGLLDAAE